MHESKPRFNAPRSARVTTRCTCFITSLLLIWAISQSSIRSADTEAKKPDAPTPAPTAAVRSNDDSESGAEQSTDRKSVERSVAAGLNFLRATQHPDGSFGNQQQHLQTGLAILAFLSAGATADIDSSSALPKAAAWMLQHTGDDGFLGDGEAPHESHAVSALALSELIGMLPDPTQDAAIVRRADDALRYTLAVQDKAVGAEFYGGWKIAPKDKGNDRRVTAWCLYFLKSMELRRREIPKSAYARALSFMEGSQKVPFSEKKFDVTDTGGFSYDAAGLPVISVTGAGLACMSLFGRDRERRDHAVNWFHNNLILWYGPNFYDTNFFAARGLFREMRRTEKGRRVAQAYFTRVQTMLRDHQNSDGSFQIPPANAENTIIMGKTYATALAVLILDADRELLPIDAAE